VLGVNAACLLLPLQASVGVQPGSVREAETLEVHIVTDAGHSRHVEPSARLGRRQRCVARTFGGILTRDGGNQMPAQPSCAVDSALRIIGDRWTLAIIHELSLGPRRTVELHRGFTGLSTKTLLARLRKLERSALVSRRSFSESPPRVEYSLTDKGHALLPVVREMGKSARLWDELGAHDPECKACAALNDVAGVQRGEVIAGEGADSGSRPEPQPIRQTRKRRDVTLL